MHMCLCHEKDHFMPLPWIPVGAHAHYQAPDQADGQAMTVRSLQEQHKQALRGREAPCSFQGGGSQLLGPGTRFPGAPLLGACPAAPGSAPGGLRCGGAALVPVLGRRSSSLACAGLSLRTGVLCLHSQQLIRSEPGGPCVRGMPELCQHTQIIA